MGTVIVSLGLAVLFGLALRSIYRDKKAGGCCGGCSGCSGACACSRNGNQNCSMSNYQNSISS